MLRRPPPPRAMSQMAIHLAAFVSIYALMAFLAGWCFGVDVLVRHARTQTAMVPTTTLAFACSAGALIAASFGQRMLAQLLSAFVIVVFCVTTLGQASGWPEVAALLFLEVGETEMMAPVTAIGFLMAVVAVNRLLAGDITMVNSIGIFGLSAAFALATVKFGSATGFSEFRIFVGMSLQTSLLFCLLFLAMCLTNPDSQGD